MPVLSDDQVFGARKELSDADVFGSSAPPPAPSFADKIRTALGAAGDQHYGEGAGYLVDNPLTRGLAAAGNRGATGVNELIDRVAVKPIDIIGNALGLHPGASEAFRRTFIAPNVERQAALTAPKDAGMGSLVTQTVGDLGGTIASAMASGGAGEAAPALEQAPGLAEIAKRALAGPQFRTAATIGTEGAAAHAADSEAHGEHVDNAALLNEALAHTAANLLPMGHGLPIAARVPIGAAAGLGGQAISDLAAGKASDPASYVTSAGLAALLGLVPGGGAAHEEFRATEPSVAEPNQRPAPVAEPRQGVEPVADPTPVVPPVKLYNAKPMSEARREQLEQMRVSGNAVERMTAETLLKANPPEPVVEPTPAPPRAADPVVEPAPAPEPVAPVEAPVQVAPDGVPGPEKAPRVAEPEDVRSEIGWDQVGGRLLREADTGGLKPEVTGRTSWVAKMAQDGAGESELWRNRPDRHLTEKQAHAALDKAAAGEPLKPIEQRFVDHARETAQLYADADHANMAELDAYDKASQVEQLQALRDDHAIHVDQADGAEALSLYDLIRRNALAGVPMEAMDQPLSESDAAYAARLWKLHNEATHDTHPEAAPVDQGGGAPRREDGNVEAAAPVVASAPASPEAAGPVNPPTSVKNAVTEAEADRDGILKTYSESQPEHQALMDKARATAAADPAAGRKLTGSLLANPRVIDDAETATLLHDRVRIHNELGHARAAVADKAGKTDAQQGADVARLLDLEQQRRDNDVAARQSGSKQGAALNARKMMAASDYSLESVLQRAEIASGETLTPELTKQIESMTARIAELEAQMKAAAEAKSASKGPKKTVDERMQEKVRKDIEALEGRIKQRLSACPV